MCTCCLSYTLLFLDIYTLLLYDTSNAKVKLGYYQLRFMVNKVTVYDGITKKKAWTWEVSHICGYSRIKSGSKFEIGKYVDNAVIHDSLKVYVFRAAPISYAFYYSFEKFF